MKLLKFGAIWCPGCLVMQGRFNEIKKRYPNLEIIDFDYDQNKEEVEKYNIGKILPVIIFFDEEEKELTRLIGEQSVATLKSNIEKYLKDN